MYDNSNRGPPAVRIPWDLWRLELLGVLGSSNCRGPLALQNVGGLCRLALPGACAGSTWLGPWWFELSGASGDSNCRVPRVIRIVWGFWRFGLSGGLWRFELSGGLAGSKWSGRWAVRIVGAHGGSNCRGALALRIVRGSGGSRCRWALDARIAGGLWCFELWRAAAGSNGGGPLPV